MARVDHSLGLAAAFYRIAFPFLFFTLAPGWLAKMFQRGGWQEKFGERLGLYDSTTVPARHDGVLLHAVSVGEMLLGIRIAKSFKTFSTKSLTLTTTTTTGMAQAAAAGFYPSDRIYLPVDFATCQRRMFRHLQPQVFATVESMPWPNLLREARKLGIRLAVLNARVSPRSQRRYLALRRFLSPYFAALDAVGISTLEDAVFWQTMGVPKDKIHLTGNIKFEVSPPPLELIESLRQVLAAAGLANRHPIIIGGSTFPGEEQILLMAHKKLRPAHPNLLTLIAPRHVERAPEICAEARKAGCAIWRRSACPSTSNRSQPDVLLIDTTGELRGWYALADAVFIGKSLHARGGQNPVEPVVVGRRPIFGPHMENFSSVATDLINAKLAIQISSEAGVFDALDHEIRSPQNEVVAARASALLTPHKNATLKTTRLLLDMIS